MSETDTSIQKLRDRRKRAEDWIEYAAWTAMVTGALGSVAILAIGFSDLSKMSEVLPVFTTFVAQAIVGYKLKERGQWAAWALMASYAASFALMLFVYGVWSGLVIKVAIGFVYVRGWLSTIDYQELTDKIDAAGRGVGAGAI